MRYLCRVVPLSLSFLLCTAMLFAEYPFGEIIQPYPAPIEDRMLRQRFVADAENAAQWQALHQAVLTPLAGSLQVESEGHDPYILLPPIAGAPRAGAFEFRIRMKNTMNPHAEIFWATTAQPDFLPENALRFDFMPDGEWYTYSVQFTTTDPLTRLRFDPGISAGVAEIAWVELYDLTLGEVPENPTPWFDPNWIEKVERWHTLSSGNIRINFDREGRGAVIFVDDVAVGEIYPLAYTNPILPLGGVKRVPFAETQTESPAVGKLIDWTRSAITLNRDLNRMVMFVNPSPIAHDMPKMPNLLFFALRGNELEFFWDTTASSDVFGPVFRPYGVMQQALLSGVDYLERGEHSSATASIETREHLRFAPSPMDVTMPFMSIVTDKVAFGLLWDDPHTQAIFATPDFIFGDPTKHHMGLYGQRLSGTLKIMPGKPNSEPRTLESERGETAPGSLTPGVSITTVNPFDANTYPAGQIARLERQVEAVNGMGLVARVVDTEGNPIAPASLRIERLHIEGIMQAGGYGHWSHDGWFVTTAYLFCEHWLPIIEKIDDKNTIARQFTVHTATHEPVMGELPFTFGTVYYADIVLRPISEDKLTSVSGIVLDENNRPIAETLLRLQVGGLSAESGITMRETVTGSDGRFTFENIAPQPYLISLGNNDYVPVQLPAIPGEQLGPEHFHVLRFYRVRDVEIEYVYQPDGSRDFTSGDLQSRRGTILANRNGGFQFDTGEMGGLRNVRGIMLRDRFGEMEFHMRHIGDAEQGFYDAGRVPFESITEAGDRRFSTVSRPVNLNHVYVVKSTEGTYAKFIVRGTSTNRSEQPPREPATVLLLPQHEVDCRPPGGNVGDSRPEQPDTSPGHQSATADVAARRSATYLSDVLTPLDSLILWAFNKRGGAPDIPQRFRNDEEQRLLNLAAFEQSIIVDPNGGGWRHAAMSGMEAHDFHVMYGSDFVTSIWQLTGELPEDLTRTLDHGGGHLPNPASFFLMGQAAEFRDWKRNQSRDIRHQQRPDGSFPYSGIFTRGHWEDTASGHNGFLLYQLLYTYQILGEPEALAAALKGLEFANRYTVPRGAQTWELSLHTPDIMGASRMCMANVWAYEATGDKKYLAYARKWAIRGLPFVYLWETKPLAGRDDPIMLYATTPVFGATHWVAPNWIGLPVQWCGLDYAEACFMLSKHDDTVDWWKIAEGILTTAERMQYTEGPSIGLLPDAWNITLQMPLPFDINPSVLVQQRRRLAGELPTVAIVLSEDRQFRVVSPYPTTIEGNIAVIEGAAGTTYQILVNGEVRTVESQGMDRVEL